MTKIFLGFTNAQITSLFFIMVFLPVLVYSYARLIPRLISAGHYLTLLFFILLPIGLLPGRYGPITRDLPESRFKDDIVKYNVLACLSFWLLFFNLYFLFFKS